MRLATTAHRVICGGVLLMAAGSANQALAQLGVGTVWERTDSQGKGITLTISACCNGGLRFAWNIPPMSNQPATTMTVDSPMDGTEVPTLVAGKPSGQTMAVTRVDDHHYRAIVKMGGKPFGTSNGTVAADGRTMTVESAFEGAGTTQRTTETWVRK